MCEKTACWGWQGMEISQPSPQEPVPLCNFFITSLYQMAYAIFKTGGKQYRVSEGDTVDVERLDLEVGQQATFEDVLAVSNDGEVTIGDPTVSGASISAEVVDQVRAKKVIAFKFKRRKGFHKTKGHRRLLTRLAIKSING